MWPKLSQQGFQAAGAGDAKAVKVGVDALVELAEVVEVVVRCAQGIVPQDGEEAGFFDMLIQNQRNQLRVHFKVLRNSELSKFPPALPVMYQDILLANRPKRPVLSGKTVASIGLWHIPVDWPQRTFIENVYFEQGG